ncbi:ROK family transcriptional regulator [Nonomuraea zeae]|uniref:ROK family transcriptional regulator n=1 Tax=Nonomuraea zeae TaxID=1642303 RepID=A0A5S4H3H7_9ACTN|nr:ROK family transcriptional regulator [Nonomuraea zeae]TMR39646.1 ROK family transcriptional regulator [Nonomuraea zeae]
MNGNPGRPRLLRELNDRAAVELLASSGALTRGQVSELTGLSKVTANHVVSRLEERGLVVKVGEQDGGRGPSAALYGLNPASGYVIAVEVYLDTTTAVLADITGRVLAETTVPTDVTADPAEAVHAIVTELAQAARIDVAQVQVCVIGLPGVIDPVTSHIHFCYDMPAWCGDVIDGLRQRLRLPVTIDNDVNLAAMAERALGAASDVRNFVLVWIGRGPGSAVMVGDQLLRGTVGAAGELGWMPVPGAPVSDGGFDRDRHEVGAAFQALVGWRAVRELAEKHGIAAGSAARSVAAAAADAAAGGAAGAAFLDELARRIALGVASICAVLDPELVVLGSHVGSAGGDELAGRVQRAVGRMCLARPRVVASTITDRPVVRGALRIGVEQARERVFSDAL